MFFTFVGLFIDYCFIKKNHNRFTNVEDDMKLSSNKLQKLGWKYRPLEETIADSIRSYEERGLLSQV